MFQRLNVPILGIVENMSYFACPTRGTRTSIFGEGGGQRVADEYGVPLLAQLPLDPETRVGGDEGTPITVRRPDSAQALAFRDLAARRHRAARRAVAGLGRCRRSADARRRAWRRRSVVVPIFPLPDVTFFPHTLLPLHVFEARYRAHGDGRARARPAAGRGAGSGPATRRRYAGKPAVHPVGRASGEIVIVRAAGQRPLQHPRCAGECARADRAASCRATRSTGSLRARRLDDDARRPATWRRALARIRAACRALLDRARASGRPARHRAGRGPGAAGVIADRVAAAVLPDADLRQALLETLDVERARRAAWRTRWRRSSRSSKGGRRVRRVTARARCWRCSCSLAGEAGARPWAWLGVRIRDLSEQEMDEIAKRHGIREGFGVVIVEVMEETPAAAGGHEARATSSSPSSDRPGDGHARAPAPDRRRPRSRATSASPSCAARAARPLPRPAGGHAAADRRGTRGRRVRFRRCESPQAPPEPGGRRPPPTAARGDRRGAAAARRSKAGPGGRRRHPPGQRAGRCVTRDAAREALGELSARPAAPADRPARRGSA